MLAHIKSCTQFSPFFLHYFSHIHLNQISSVYFAAAAANIPPTCCCCSQLVCKFTGFALWQHQLVVDSIAATAPAVRCLRFSVFIADIYVFSIIYSHILVFEALPKIWGN